MKKFRQNVAVIITDSNKKVLFCHRDDGRSWQFPQGGIQPGETDEETLIKRRFKTKTPLGPILAYKYMNN
ncbi:MAG: NUDIX domain-containing protein [Bacteriovoracaceae bacterium]